MTASAVRYVVQVAVLTAVYVAAAKVGLLLATVGAQVTLVWPPTGLALAAPLLGGSRLWPGVALGATLVNASTGVPVATACGIGAGNTLEAVTAVALLRRVGFLPSLERLRDVFALVGLAAGLSMIASATIGVTSLLLGGVLPLRNVATAWGTWWLGDALGDLVVAPLLLVLAVRRWHHLKARRSCSWPWCWRASVCSAAGSSRAVPPYPCSTLFSPSRCGLRYGLGLPAPSCSRAWCPASPSGAWCMRPGPAPRGPYCATISCTPRSSWASSPSRP